MRSPILGTAEVERNRFDSAWREIVAGLIFAAAAIEYQHSNRSRACTCRDEAEDCYTTALDIIRKAWLTDGQLEELESMLNQLQQRLDLSRDTKLPTLPTELVPCRDGSPNKVEFAPRFSAFIQPAQLNQAY